MDTWCTIGQTDADDRVDVYAAFGYDPCTAGSCTVGLAYTGTACTSYYKTSFNEYQGTATEDAYVNTYVSVHDNFGLRNYLRHRLIVISFCFFIIIQVLAHEMGHNFGMLHDFDETHGGTGDYSTSTNDCNNKGIMSYGDGVPTEWSSCSVSDFTGSYNSNGWGDKCLASKNNNI